MQSGEEPIVTLSHSRRKHVSRLGRLRLNDTEVGVVTVRGHSGSWTFGEFAPSPQFSAFVGVFANWSLLLHSESADGRLSDSLGKAARV